jgi:very-short-patch-repair endonuclease
MRRRPTEVERRLWRLLRDRRFVGAKFRRQHPIGPFIVDFYCEKARLTAELDGGGHAEHRGSSSEMLFERRRFRRAG